MRALKPSPPGCVGLASRSRRRFLGQLGLGAAWFTTPGLFAEELARRTPFVEEGPFYPPKLPLDTDNDLMVTVDFAPLKGSRIGELGARFDIVLGFAPEA